MAYLREKIELSAAEAQLRASEALSGYSPPQRNLLIFCLVAIVPAFFIAKYGAYYYYLNDLNKNLLIAHASFSVAAPPTVGKVYITKAADNYAAAIQLTNNNLDLSLEKQSYQFNFYNQAHEQVYTEPGKLFLLPGETKYVVVPKVNSTDPIVSAELQLPGSLHWQKRLSIPQVKLVANTPHLYNQSDPLAFVAEGDIYNDSPYRLLQIEISFLLYNSGGQVVAVSERTESDIKPFERRTYKQLWPGIYSTDVSRALVQAETDALDNQNITLPQDNSSSSDLSRPQISQ